MGYFTEQAKQKLHMTTLKGTPNTRNESMLNEANNFLHVLKETEKVVLKLKTHGARVFTHTSKLLTQLPRPQDLDPHTGMAAPVIPTHTFTSSHGASLPKDYIPAPSGATYYAPGAMASGVYLEATSAAQNAPAQLENVAHEQHTPLQEAPMAPGTPGASPTQYEGEQFEDPVGMPAAAATTTYTTSTSNLSQESMPYTENPGAIAPYSPSAEGSMAPSTPRSEGLGVAPPVLTAGGPDLHTEQLNNIAANMEIRLENEVLKPLHGWMKKHEKVKADMKKADRVRLDLDAARRTFYKTEMKHVKQQKALKPTAQLERDLAAHEASLNVATQRWNDTEAAMYTELADLINDGRGIRNYMARAMTIAEESFRSATVH